MMNRKKFTIDPVGRGIKFKFDKESTKDFGGMVVDRKSSTEGRIPRQQPVVGGKPKNEDVARRKGGAGRSMGMGNKNNAMNKDNRGPGGPGGSRSGRVKKVAKKRPPFVVDTFKG